MGRMFKKWLGVRGSSSFRLNKFFVCGLELAVRSASINTVWGILNYSLKSEVNLAVNNRQLSFHIESNRHKFYSNAVRRAQILQQTRS